MKKLTAFTIHTTAEGEHCAYMYSDISETGSILQSNVQESCIILDREALAAVQKIKDFLAGRLS